MHGVDIYIHNAQNFSFFFFFPKVAPKLKICVGNTDTSFFRLLWPTLAAAEPERAAPHRRPAGEVGTPCLPGVPGGGGHTAGPGPRPKPGPMPREGERPGPGTWSGGGTGARGSAAVPGSAPGCSTAARTACVSPPPPACPSSSSFVCVRVDPLSPRGC